jgi:WD40 repeat protein
VTRLIGHSAAISSATWSPDGALIATASWDHTVRLWEATTGKEWAVHHRLEVGPPWPEGGLVARRGQSIAAWSGRQSHRDDDAR